jgi:hypothetical protein
VGQTLADAARSAFIDGFHAALLAGAGVTVRRCRSSPRVLPAHARDHDQELQRPSSSPSTLPRRARARPAP